MQKHILLLTNKYADFFSKLNSKNTKDLKELISKKIVFSDPFQNIVGENNFIKIFDHMFVNFKNAEFKINDCCASEISGFIKWTFKGKTKGNKEIKLIGITELKFNSKGKVTEHIDYWDSSSQLLINIPIFGFFIKRLMALFRA